MNEINEIIKDIEYLYKSTITHEKQQEKVKFVDSLFTKYNVAERTKKMYEKCSFACRVEYFAERLTKDLIKLIKKHNLNQ